MNYILTTDLKLSRLHTIFLLLRGKWKFFFVPGSFIVFLKFWWNRWVSRHQNDFLTDWFLFFSKTVVLLAIYYGQVVLFRWLYAIKRWRCHTAKCSGRTSCTNIPSNRQNRCETSCKNPALPKVNLNSLFRMLMIQWQAHHFVWTIQWCQDTQLVTPAFWIWREFQLYVDFIFVHFLFTRLQTWPCWQWRSKINLTQSLG